MTEPISIAIILGSGRQGRMCDVVAEWTSRQLKAAGGFDVQLVDPLRLDATAHGRHHEGGHREIAGKLAKAEGFIVVTPEYNHSFTGELKLLLDTFGPEWRDKPVGFISYGGISGGLRAVEHLRQVFAELRAVGLRDTVSFAGVWSRFSKDGELQDPQKAEEAIAKLLAQLERWTNFLRDTRKRQSVQAAS